MDDEFYTNDVFDDYNADNEFEEGETDYSYESSDNESSGKEDDGKEDENMWHEHVDENYVNFLKTVYQCVREGLSRTDIFSRLYSEFHLEYIEYDTVEKYFNYFENDPEQFRLLPDIERSLIRRIAQAYARYQSSINVWSERDLVWETFKMLDGRYAISFAGNSAARSFHLLDSFHGHKRQVLIENAHPEFFKLCQFNLEVVNSKCVLLFENIHEQNYFNVFLLSLDLEEAKCRILWRVQKIDGLFKCLIFDSQDRMKFVVHIYNNRVEDASALLFMSVDGVNERITISELFPFNQKLCCARLLGSKLQTIKFNAEDNEESNYRNVFGEYNLSPHQEDRSFQELFEIETELSVYNSLKLAFCWNKNICFILLSSERTWSKTQFRIFNTDTHQMFHVNSFFTNLVMEVHVDENNVLTVCDQTRRELVHYVYRYQTNKPDSLLNKAFLWIKRRKDLLNRVSCCLPLTLKPLSICNEVQSPVRSYSGILKRMKLMSLNQQTGPANKRQRME